MKLRKPLIAIIASLPLVYMAACSSPLIYNGVWQSKPVTIDGKATEWKIPLDYYDDKTKLNFSITNDNTNLYFCVRATEDITQKGIIRNGLQIWIDTIGGKKGDIGIQFPIIAKSESSSGSSSRHSQSQSSESPSPDETTASAARTLKAKYAGTPRQIKLTGFTNATSGLAELPNIYGINACLNWDTNNIMIYEIAIPFNTFYKAVLSPSDTSKVLGVSFTVAVPSGNSGIGSHGGGGAGNMGGGGMGHGGMGGSGGGGGGHGGHGGSSSGTESTEVLTAHIKFRLAVGATK